MNSLMTHFGLGAATQIDAIVVHWPSGAVDTISNPNINEVIVIEEGQTLSAIGLDNNEIRLYPNPVNDFLNITIKGNTSSNYAIYNLAGKLIQEMTMLPASNQINIKSLKSGIYFIHLNTNQKTTIHKIVKK